MKKKVLQSALTNGSEKTIGTAAPIFPCLKKNGTNIISKIDNIMLDRENGNIICAFDEVADTGTVVLEDKKKKILEKNVEEKGGRLKYGLKIEQDKKGQRKLILDKITEIPIFYLALPERYVKSGIANLVPSFEEKSDDDKKLFAYFIQSLKAQVEKLQFKELRFSPLLKTRFRDFARKLSSL